MKGRSTALWRKVRFGRWNGWGAGRPFPVCEDVSVTDRANRVRRESEMENNVKSNARSGANILKFIVLNLIGIFMFFVTITIAGSSSIPVDHVVTAIREIPYFDLVYGAAIVVIGAVLPFIRKTWNKDKVTMVFSF